MSGSMGIGGFSRQVFCFAILRAIHLLMLAKTEYPSTIIEFAKLSWSLQLAVPIKICGNDVKARAQWWRIGNILILIFAFDFSVWR